ncbi:MAG: hypothetical protein AAF542_15570 [Pseudomonadota bacterium]
MQIRYSHISRNCMALLTVVFAIGACTPEKESLEVTATAYNSLPAQTQGDPEIGAWGDRLDPDIQTIAVSRDLLSLGLTHNAVVEIDGMAGSWLVRDKLNRRFTKRIDVYMGKDLQAAREFGKQTVTIRWQPK